MRTDPSLPASPVQHFCQDTSIDYLTAGEAGPAVVLLHGWGAFKEIWWSTLIELAPHVRAYAPDMPGHGGSPLLGCASMDKLAARIALFCEARGLERVALVGHSLGGNVVLELALARPDLVERLVLCDPAAQPGDLPAFARSFMHQDHGWAILRASLVLARPLRAVGRRVPHAHGGGLVRPALRRLSYMSSHDADALRALLGGLFANPLSARLADVRAPTLVVSGEFDPLVPPALSQRVAGAIPGARYAVVRGAAHTPMDERPREFARILLDFLAAPAA